MLKQRSPPGTSYNHLLPAGRLLAAAAPRTKWLLPIHQVPGRKGRRAGTFPFLPRSRSRSFTGAPSLPPAASCGPLSAGLAPSAPPTAAPSRVAERAERFRRVRGGWKITRALAPETADVFRRQVALGRGGRGEGAAERADVCRRAGSGGRGAGRKQPMFAEGRVAREQRGQRGRRAAERAEKSRRCPSAAAPAFPGCSWRSGGGGGGRRSGGRRRPRRLPQRRPRRSGGV